MAKAIVRIAFNREAADIFSERSWETLVRYARRHPDEDLDFQEIEFSTFEEAAAYIRGIEDGNGWDSPYAEATGLKQDNQTT